MQSANLSPIGTYSRQAEQTVWVNRFYHSVIQLVCCHTMWKIYPEVTNADSFEALRQWLFIQNVVFFYDVEKSQQSKLYCLGIYYSLCVLHQQNFVFYWSSNNNCSGASSCNMPGTKDILLEMKSAPLPSLDISKSAVICSMRTLSL